MSNSYSWPKFRAAKHSYKAILNVDPNSSMVFVLVDLFPAQGTSVEIRQAAGLLLKNNLKSAYKSVDPAYQLYIKSELLPCLGAADKHIRTTVGTIISVVVQQGTIFGWPELLQALMQCFDSDDFNHMEGAMDTLSKVSLIKIMVATFMKNGSLQLCMLLLFRIAFLMY